MTDRQHLRTVRLRLAIPQYDDLAQLHAIYGDPRTWTHYPTLLHDEATTRTMLTGWETDGLGPWVVRSLDDDTVLGNAGCWLRPGGWWNLGYGFVPDAHGRGLASEAARPALAAAADVRPDVPVIASLLEHNVASRRVAEKLGLTLQHRAPDDGNPDPSAVRLVYSDRELTQEQLAARLR